MPCYETVLIARQDVSAGQVEKMSDGFIEILTNDGAKLSRREYWGLRNLSYRINKNRKGHYVLFNYEARADAVAEMQRRMQLHDDVLRYQTVRVRDLPEGPSVVMQRREERGRGPRGEHDRDGPRRDRGERGDYRPRHARPDDTVDESTAAKQESEE